MGSHELKRKNTINKSLNEDARTQKEIATRKIVQLLPVKTQ